MKRMLEGDGSGFERGLLDALKSERPSAELEQRMRDALGLGPVPSIPPPAPPIVATKAGLGAGAVAAGAVVAALLVGGGLMLKRPSTPSNEPPSAPMQPAPKTEPEPAPEATVAAPAANAPEPAMTEPETPKPRVGAHSAPAPSQSLREEIQLIDAARVAVKEKDGVRARRVLDLYSRRFPNGAFREEARLLRREAQKNAVGP